MSGALVRVGELASQLAPLWAAVERRAVAPVTARLSLGKIEDIEAAIFDAVPATAAAALVILALGSSKVADLSALDITDERADELQRIALAMDRAVRVVAAELGVRPFAVLGDAYGLEMDR